MPGLAEIDRMCIARGDFGLCNSERSAQGQTGRATTLYNPRRDLSVSEHRIRKVICEYETGTYMTEVWTQN